MREEEAPPSAKPTPPTAPQLMPAGVMPLLVGSLGGVGLAGTLLLVLLLLRVPRLVGGRVGPAGSRKEMHKTLAQCCDA